MTGPTIREVRVFPVRLPVTGSFQFASGSAGTAGDTAPLVLVQVLDSDGCHGWGEGRPMPQWSYETVESAVTTIRGHLAPAVRGVPVTDRVELHRRMHAAIGRGPSSGQPVAKAAVDVAVHDLLARRAGLPLRCLLGGSPERRCVELSFTVTAHDAEGAREQVRSARDGGFSHFNCKVAVAPQTDVEMVQAVRDAAGPDAFVWADGNQGCTLPDALRLAPALAAARVDLFEQPFPADRSHLLERLRPHCPVPLAVDEASVSPSDFFAHACRGLVDYLVVKVTRSAGIWPTLQQVAVAESAGLPVVTSGLTDGLLTKLAVCQVVAAHGTGSPAALNGSQFLDESALYPNKRELEPGGEVRLPETPGVGVEPSEEGLRDVLDRELV